MENMQFETLTPDVENSNLQPSLESEATQTEASETVEIRESLKMLSGELVKLRQENIAGAESKDRERLENDRDTLEKHEDNVLYYANVVSNLEGLSQAEKDLVLIAAKLHDGAKLTAPLLEHHIISAELAVEILSKYRGEKIRSITIGDKTVEYVRQAILRHQNHPFLVKLNNNKRFPEPVNDIDKVVFNADMLANIGFKNVAFRLNDENFLQQDIDQAKKSGKPVIVEVFNNVMEEVLDMPKVVLEDESKDYAKQLVNKIKELFREATNQLIDCQDRFSENGLFNKESIESKGGVSKLIGEINKILAGNLAKVNIADTEFARFKV